MSRAISARRCTCQTMSVLPFYEHQDECMLRQPQKYIHRLLEPQPETAYLCRLVLCWLETGPPPGIELRAIAVTRRTELVDCPDCLEILSNADNR